MRRTTDTSGSIKDINENCLTQFRTHWQCLENHNQQLWNCRSEERKLNKCVFEKLVRLSMLFYYYFYSLLPETGEDDTRCAQGRDASPPAHTQHLCNSLAAVHLLLGAKCKGNQEYHFKCLNVTIQRFICIVMKRAVYQN